jgi:DNA-directed RNA polymerase specialized sigma24 family protein
MEPEGIALRMTAYPRENSGELAAFERIMSQCERRVLRVALRLLNNPQDAQDAAQEVFLRLTSTSAIWTRRAGTKRGCIA